MQRLNLRVTVALGLVLALVCVSLLSTEFGFAQDGDEKERRLSVGQAVTGTLDEENFAETYVFDASTGDTATLTAITSSEDLSLAMLLTAPNGVVIASDGDLATATVATLANVELPLDGTYVVTVMRGTGADGDTSGDYTLSLTGNINVPVVDASTDDTATPRATPQIATNPDLGRAVFVQLDEGTIDIQLEWSSAVDLNLEVRDPVGGAIYWENPQVVSGGAHGGNANQDCATATADAPTETVNWTTSSVPVGSYELLIYYTNNCGVAGPQSFTLTAGVNGAEPAIINGLVNPNQVYLARVEVDLQKNWSLFNGGVNTGVIDIYNTTNALPATIGQTANGTISNDNVDDAYTFFANSGDNLTFNVQATSGSLDTLLVLLNSNGQRIDFNDDAGDGTTNSSLTANILNSDDYTIVVTRYGQAIGGTEGNYALTVNTQAVVANPGDGTQATPAPVSNTLPQGNAEITLTWGTGVDLQLLVRDPSGNAVYDDSPSVPSGGILGAVGNQGCVPATGTTPTSYIYWPNTPPRGTFEIEVWFQSTCDTGISSTDMNLIVQVGDNNIFNSGVTTLTEGGKYMVTFTLPQTGEPVVGDAGTFVMNDLSSGGLTYQAVIDEGTFQNVEYGDSVQGTITQDAKFVMYAFDGRSGDRITVSARKTSGSLDTALYIISDQGIPVGFNDDIVDPDAAVRDTNSRISGVTLPNDGVYYIIVTHYGLQFGGTEGGFLLDLTLLP